MRPDKYLVGMLLTLLPQRFREGMQLRGPALTCSIVQILGAILILIMRLFMVAAAEQSSLQGDAKEMFLQGGGSYMAMSSIAGMAAFWFHPFHMFLYYMLFEGVLRLMAALAGDQILGSLPIHAVVALSDQRRKARHNRSLGPLVVDEVIRRGKREGYDLKIYSCRPKLNWNAYMTIEFEGELYQMVKEEQVSGPRRFVFYLRTNPVGRSAVVVKHYRMDDVLQPARDKTSWQQLRDKLISSMDPVVEDKILVGTTRSDYDLKIYSSQPKLEWDSQATIQFENRLYEMFKEESGAKPRRFVYFLRKNPAGRVGKTILQYKQTRDKA
jgi:hypothetical protein